MELMSLAMLAGTVSVSAFVGTYAERLVQVVENQMKRRGDSEHRLVVESVQGKNDKISVADMRLD